MKNVWLDEIRICTIAESISICLGKTFISTQANMDDWGKHSLDMMRELPPRIRDSLMWKYTFKYKLDEQEQVQSLEFVKLPWLI